MLVALILACGSEEKDTSDVSNELEEYEGDAAGECSDGADNDRDGKIRLMMKAVKALRIVTQEPSSEVSTEPSEVSTDETSTEPSSE